VMVLTLALVWTANQGSLACCCNAINDLMEIKMNHLTELECAVVSGAISVPYPNPYPAPYPFPYPPSPWPSPYPDPFPFPDYEMQK
jgi:hypothetical protein